MKMSNLASYIKTQDGSLNRLKSVAIFKRKTADI